MTASQICKNVVLTRSKLGWALEGRIGDPEPGGIVGVTRDHIQEIQEAVTRFIEFENYGIDTNIPLLESKEITLAKKPYMKESNKYMEDTRHRFYGKTPSGKCPIIPNTHGSDSSDSRKRWSEILF